MRPDRFESSVQPAATPFRRDSATIASYLLLAMLTYAYNLIGPVMPFLREDLGLSFSEGGYHTTAMALGLSITGFYGDDISRKIGRREALRLSLCLMALGMALLCGARHLPTSIIGSVLIGCGGALTLVTAPTIMAERHGSRVGTAYGEANVLAYVGVILVPIAVTLAVATAGWRWSFLPGVLAYVLFWLAIRRIDLGEPAPKPEGEAKAALGLAFWLFWAFLMLTVSAEICLLVWSPSYLETVAGLAREDALWASTIFPIGMMIGRIAGAFAVRRWPMRWLVMAALGLAMAGFVIFSSSRTAPVSMAGLFFCALGMANFYPFGITLAVTGASGRPGVATSRISLASGAAMVSAPYVVGVLSDVFGIGAAFLIIPAYIVAAAIYVTGGISLTGANDHKTAT